MFAVMFAPAMLSGPLTVALFYVSLLAVLMLGSVTAPKEFRKVTGGLAVAVALSAFLILPNIIIRCYPEYWWFC